MPSDNDKTIKQPQPRKCLNCYFARWLDHNLLCAKNPPLVDKHTGCAKWPIVKENDICGAFRFTGSEHIDQNHLGKNDLPICRDLLGDYCKIPLTQGKYVKVDPQDYIWLSQFRWHCKVNKSSAYAVRSIRAAGRPERIYMHRLIMDTPSHLVCDHINHNGLDNRRQNIRNCTIQQNNANVLARGASSRYKGVSWNKRRRRWFAYIKKDGKQFNLGCFDKEIKAAKAYDAAARKHHGQFAALNFPD